MKDIHIAQTIARLRKVKGVTQEELANYIGISKASVSKWETGQSYPDITFLPQLATYFNISIDQLMDYQPQLSKAAIRSYYSVLSQEFVEQPFEHVLQTCRNLVKNYFSCYPLLQQVGILLLNHINLVKNEEDRQDIIEEAKLLFIKVKIESDDPSLIKEAIYMEAYSLLALQLPEKVIDILGEENEMLLSPEILLASAYQMLDRKNDAKNVLQIQICQHLMAMIQLISTYLPLAYDDPAYFEELLHRFHQLQEIFHLKDLHPSVLLQVSLSASLGYLSLGNKEKALTYLAQYTNIATGNLFPLQLNGDDFFPALENWFDKLMIGNQPPRNDKIIRQSIFESVAQHPLFETLSKDKEYQSILKQLKSII